MAPTKRRRGWRTTCLFAVASDAPLDAAATWERSRPALAIQNGVEACTLGRGAFDVGAFTGDKAFKASQTAWREVIEARLRSLALRRTLMCARLRSYT